MTLTCSAEPGGGVLCCEHSLFQLPEKPFECVRDVVHLMLSFP